MDIGDPASLSQTLSELLHRDNALENILPAFTENVARLLRLSHKGLIAVGHDADLVLLSDDHSVHSVMINGEWHRKNNRQLILGSFENN
jgi:beta-aspartyl-dipeptidase (metallo-type)